MGGLTGNPELHVSRSTFATATVHASRLPLPRKGEFLDRCPVLAAPDAVFKICFLLQTRALWTVLVWL